MKKTKRHAWQLLGVVALLAMIAGCSDGEMATPMNADITPPAPMVIKFAATPSTIESGGSTTISWEVAGADEVEITAVSSTGATVNFDVKTEDLSGEAPVSLTSTTDFVLTATKSAENLETEEGEEITDEGEDITLSKGGQIQFGPEPVDEEPSGSAAPAISSVTQTITVTVADVSDLTATLNADKPVVAVGEQTVIRWTVNPAENVSVVVTADSGETISPTDACEGSITDILGQPVADPVPAVGCAVVAPSTMTTYSVTATDASANSASDTAVVDVEGDVEAKIMAAKDDSSPAEDNLLMVESFSKPVIVSWTVTPDAAKVTVTATPSATCDLPTDADGQTTGSVSCTISGETKFTITATLGTETDTDDVVVTAAGGNAGLVVADAWAFQGERTSLEMKLTSNSSVSSVAKVTVAGNAIESSLLESLKAGSTITVFDIDAQPPQIHIELLDSSGNKLYETDKVQVIELVIDSLDSDEAAVSSLIFDNHVRYAGIQMAGYNEGMGKIKKDGSAKYFDFGSAIQDFSGMNGLWNDAFFQDMETYPAAVAVRKGKPDELYAGVTGAIMRSTDGGNSWKDIMISRRRSAGSNYSSDYEGHATCGRAAEGGQKIQAHRKPQFAGDFVSLNQVCDVITLDNGRVIAAMDFGVMVEKDIDNDKDMWVGIVDSDDPAPDALTFGKVVNDLLEVDGKIFAATSAGIFVSPADKGGIGWEPFGDDVDGPVWALAYDERNQKIYAGNDEGLHESSVSSPDWDNAGYSSEVIAIAVDPKSPVAKMTIVVGTSTGVMITRDGGSNWAPVQLTGEPHPVEAIAIDAKASSGSNVEYRIAIGTADGELLQKVTVGAQTVSDSDLPSYSLAPSVTGE